MLILYLIRVVSLFLEHLSLEKWTILLCLGKKRRGKEGKKEGKRGERGKGEGGEKGKKEGGKEGEERGL